MKARWIFAIPFLFTVGLTADYIYANPLDSTPTEQCMEDEPCWDCETMGNLICGPDPFDYTPPPTPTTIWIGDQPCPQLCPSSGTVGPWQTINDLPTTK